MPSVWLVTGATGFLGRHLLAEVRRQAPSTTQVLALGRRCPRDVPAPEFVRADLEQVASLVPTLARLRPDVVLHAAGQTPPASYDRFFRSNTLATLHLIEALRSLGRPVRVVIAGSAAELGPVPEAALPVNEEYPCRPVEPYGVSKWLATQAALMVGAPIEVVVARLFNPIGPGLPAQQALGRFVRHLTSRQPDPLRLVVGDVHARRDFIDVRDVARAMIALVRAGRAGQVYHVGTGRSRCVGDGLRRLIALSGRRVEVEVRPDAGRPPGPSDSRADISRIVAQTGWTPRIAWEQSLDDLWVDAWSRARLPLTASDPLV